MTFPTPKPGILGISAYSPGRATKPDGAKAIKLSANENALGASPLAQSAFLRCSAQLHLYPDSQARALRRAIAEKFELEPERIVFGCGSDEIFALLAQAYLSPGDMIAQPEYGFAAWAIAARAAGGDVKSAPEKNHTVDVDALLAAVDARTRIIFVANPANPTGTRLPFSEIRRLHASLPSDILLVLDGAYAEYARGASDYDDGLSLARNAGNIIVTRTFSKLYGLAALRIGWGYVPAPVADALERIRPPFNTTRPAQAAALAALEDHDFVERSIAFAERGREQLSAALTALGLEPIPSATNFVTARFPKGFPASAAEAEQRLASRGLLVRGLSNYGMPDFLRITIGPDKHMRAVISVLEECARSPR